MCPGDLLTPLLMEMFLLKHPGATMSMFHPQRTCSCCAAHPLSSSQLWKCLEPVGIKQKRIDTNNMFLLTHNNSVLQKRKNNGADEGE